MTTSTGSGGTPDPLLGGAGGTSGTGGAYPPAGTTGSSSGTTGTAGTSGGGGTTEQAKAAGGTAKEESKHVAGTAKQEGQRVAGTAKEEAGNVAQEAATQARNLVDEARSQATEQSRAGQDRLAQALRQIGDELHEMAQNSSSSGMASDAVRQVADRSRSASSFLEQREPGDIVDEVRRFASRRPGAFLLGALAAGVAAGRLSRGAAKAHNVGPEKQDTTDIRPVGTGTAGTEVRPPVGAPADTGVTAGGVATGPAVDPVEPGYGSVPTPGTTRPGGTAP